MSGYTQHIYTNHSYKNTDSNIIQVECEKTGTIFWKNTTSKETAWTQEELESHKHQKVNETKKKINVDNK